MRILIWKFASFQRNYSSYHLYEGIVHSILDRGHEVWLAQMDYGLGDSLPKSFERQSNLHIVNIPYAVDKNARVSLKQRYIADIKYTRNVYNAVKRFAPFDSVLIQSHNSPRITLSYAKRLNSPCVYSEQDIFPLNALLAGLINKGIIYRIASFLATPAYIMAAKTITISEDMAQEIRALGCPAEKVEVIPNWCRSDRDYLVRDEDNEFLKANPSVKQNRFRAFYAGNIGLMQNVDVVVEAAKLLRDENVDFYIIGGGNSKEELVQKAYDYSLSNVHFLDSVPESIAQDVYAAADVNLIPLKQGVVRTCMPSKTAACIYVRHPFIATVDEGSWASKLYRSVPFGMSVEPENPKALADAIMLCREKFGSRYLAAAHEPSERMFASSNAVRYAMVLEEVAAANRKAGQ